MAKYEIQVRTEASANFTIQADTLEEAINEAYREGVGSLCHQCSREVELGEDWEVNSESVYRDDKKIPASEVDPLL